jgi:crotonobetainyl-CoA:carnitine CoA-transferase CaiB-like acyl-CoA transferase
MLMGGIAPYGTYRTKDGGAVSLGALEPKFWKAFCREAGLECGMDALVPGPHQEEWKRKVADAIAARTRDEWAEIGARADCCLEPVLMPDELVDDPQHAAREILLSQGSLPTPRTPIASAPARGEAPQHGAQSREILAETGFTDADVTRLKELGVIDG